MAIPNQVYQVLGSDTPPSFGCGLARVVINLPPGRFRDDPHIVVQNYPRQESNLQPTD